MADKLFDKWGYQGQPQQQMGGVVAPPRDKIQERLQQQQGPPPVDYRAEYMRRVRDMSMPEQQGPGLAAPPRMMMPPQLPAGGVPPPAAGVPAMQAQEPGYGAHLQAVIRQMMHGTPMPMRGYVAGSRG